MPEKPHNRPLLFLAALVALLLLFDGYYFFIRRGVWPGSYVQQLLARPEDNFTRSRIYNDLYEEYRQLNTSNRFDSLIVFAGDSITKGFNIQEFAGSNRIVNRGIFHDTTRGLLERLDTNINNLKIDKLFVMIGYNDLGFRSDEEIVRNIGDILARSKAKKIYLQSFLPVSSDRKGTNERILHINEQLKALALDKGYVYVDVHAYFAYGRNGIDPRLTTDGVHPNYLGYQLWYSVIQPLL